MNRLGFNIPHAPEYAELHDDACGGSMRVGSGSDDGLLYGKGGYTNAKAKASYFDGVDTFRDSDKLEGYRLGAGVETNVMGALARVEYRYSSYGEYRGTGIDVERHQVALLVGYRF